MPLIRIIGQPAASLGIWKVTEDESALKELARLTPEDLEKLEKIENPRRRKEFIVVRILLHQLRSGHYSIGHEITGKPYLENSSSRISISHSRDLVAVILADHHEAGIDIERLEDRIRKVADRFLNPMEKNWLGPDPSLKELYLVWSAKEVLYKLYSLGNLDFREQMGVDPFPLFESGQFTARLKFERSEKSFRMSYLFEQNFLVVWSVG